MTVRPPTKQGFPNNPWMVALIFGAERPENRVRKRDEMCKWCFGNLSKEFYFVKTKYAYFYDEGDAILFYMMFR